MTNACTCGWHDDPLRHKRQHDVTCPERMRWALDAIADILDGHGGEVYESHAWGADTCLDVAYVLRANGYVITRRAALPVILDNDCRACGNLLTREERDLCGPCAAVMGEDLAQRDKPAGNPGLRCSDACGHCGRCGDE